MYDVSLYGHMTIDRIFDHEKKDVSIGSIGNVWKCLNRINPSLKINIEPTDFGEALILVDTDKSERASKANLSLKTRKPSFFFKSRWNHIMYINELASTSFINHIDSGIISADICRGSDLKDLNVLKKIDFLFLSDEDVFMEIQDILELVRRCVILHSKCGSICYNIDGSRIETRVDQIENINVLGCGDMLAAYFIDQYLIHEDVSVSIENAHNMLSSDLIGRNE
jgi:hypothetical protein